MKVSISGYRSKYRVNLAFPVGVSAMSNLPIYGSQAYKDKVLGIATANLIAYWPLDEVSGTNAVNYEGTSARDGTYTGVSLNNSTFSDGGAAGLWDGTNDYCDVYSTGGSGLADVFDTGEGTMGIWGKVSASGVWSDSAFRRLVQIGATTASNTIYLSKTGTTNQLRFEYAANGTSETITDTSLAGSTDWFHVAITWSKSADSGNGEVKAYINGSQVGSTQSIAQTWVGALSSTICCIGARRTTPDIIWDGWLAHCNIWDTPLSATNIEKLATV